MALPADLQFSQGSLQDYVDCPRRFQLRYVERRRWPAVKAEPALESERHLQLGAAFHRLIQQHLTGIPAKRLKRTANEPELRRWWRNYLESGPADLPRARYPEVELSAPLSLRSQTPDSESAQGFRLVAKYDLVAVEPGKRAVIVDWKTNRKRPGRKWLSKRLQSRVYPYLLVRAGAQLNGEKSIEPEQVTMLYWFANFPARPERFSYDAAQHMADERRLTKLVEEIEGKARNLEGEAFQKASDERHCRYCRYRSLCQRGVEAGSFDEAEGEASLSDGINLDLDFDFEQIGEVTF